MSPDAHSDQNEGTGPLPSSTSEGAILGRVFERDQGTLSVAAARAIVDLGFPEPDQDRMRQLSAKAREGTLSADEQVEIDNYERVGHILSLLKLKASRSLRGRVATRDATNH